MNSPSSGCSPRCKHFPLLSQQFSWCQRHIKINGNHMALQQNACALTTERAMQFITTIGEIFEGHGISHCKIKPHEAGHLIKSLTQWQKETFAILQLYQPVLLLFTFSQHHQEPFLLEGLNSTFHLLNDFPTQYFIWCNNIAPSSLIYHNNAGQNIT